MSAAPFWTSRAPHSPLATARALQILAVRPVVVQIRIEKDGMSR